ncbi:neogenin [Condylostylus longicornis]|uniref:neogenin n=1 Tax=Condylostylus longicornis TaxID=2530218 RepID=UPI00244DF940|nr:neogenin [Condylostylus longicornis]
MGNMCNMGNVGNMGNMGKMALEFSIEPSDVVVPEGHSVLLQCSGTVQQGALKEGKTAPNIRWRGPDGQDIGIVGDTFRTQLKNGSLYISSVEENRGLTGAYQCLLSVDGIGTIVSRSAIVSIARLPDLNQDFIELYLLPGQTAYFRCMIGQMQSGVQYNIQWLKDEQPLQMDKIRMIIMPNGALEIDEITNSDRGIYQCNVTFGNISKLSSKTNLNIKKSASNNVINNNDGIGTINITNNNINDGNIPAISNNINENVQAPSFLVGPSPQTVKEGDIVTLNCVANGIPKPQMRWLRNGEEIDLNDLDSRFSIIGSGSLQISSAEDIDSGNYQCRSSNSVDSLDAEATVQVQVPPKFVQNPTDKIAFEKEELEFECSIRGKPKPVIKWLKNGDIITPNEYMQIVGGHNLKILGLLKSDAGMFQCVGSNPAGSIQASAQLKITQPGKHKKQSQTTKSLQTPSINNTNKKGVFKSGDTLTQRSKSIADNKVISKSALDSLLSKDKKKIIDFSSTGNESIEKIKNMKNNNKNIKDNTETYDDYDYYDDLSDDNDDNDNNKNFDNLNVKNKKHNNNKDYDKNDTFHIPIDIDDEDDEDTNDNTKNNNNNDTNIDNDDDIDDDDDDNDDDDDDDDDDDEEYIVKFEKGDDPEKILNSFNDKKFKLKKHHQEHENEKKIHSKTTKLINDPIISQHQEVNSYDDDDDDNDDDNDDDIDNDDDNDNFDSLLPNITKKYHSNLDANQLASVPLPGPPRDLLAQIVKPRFVALSWMEPLKNPDEVISYSVYYKMHTSERERKIQTKSRDDQQVNIQSLLPGKTYQFRVVGNSNHGQGESSEVLEVSTQPEENIAGPPQNVEGYALSHKEILLKWQPPTVTNGIISKYRIYYAEDESGAEMYADSTTLTTTLSELRPYTEYTITVVPFNQNGMGDSSNEIKVKTFSSTPSEPPSNVTLEVTSSTSITIHWEPPPIEDRNGQINGYKIRYRKLKEAPQVKTTAANIRHYELNNLDRFSEYQVKIAAMTVNGSGPFTEWHRVVTLENDLDETQVPGKPRWISIRPGAGKIALHWAPPAQQDIKIRSYILGWGKGIPDENTIELKESDRYYEIKDLDINSEYVISLRARNIKGDGPPIYDNVKTREEEPLDIPAPLEVPVGLRAITMSSSSIVVYWIDTTLSKSQHVIDNRHYSVRYSTVGSNRYRYHNTTDLNCMITDLKPNTQYEFAVKVVKGRRESAWSMSVLNSTLPNVPLSPPRDLVVRVDEYNPQNVLLQWQPPKHIIGQVTGYSVFYTTDINKRDRDWQIEQVIGDTNTAVIKGLKPYTTYYFKIMTKTAKGNTPFSALISYTTGPAVLIQETNILSKGFDNQMILYTIIGVTAVLLFIALAVIVLVCNKKPPVSPEHNKKSYQKNNIGAPKPPDLWIHHEQMELKNIDKSHHTPEIITGCSDGASSSGAMTLPRSAIHEYDSESNGGPAHVTNSLDKRAYVPGYMTTSMNSTMERPQYPRTQYNVSTRSHMNVDTTLSQQSLSAPQNNSLAQTPEHPYNAYEQMPNYTNPNTPYIPPGMNMDSSKSRGHPLKSFSVPGPPPLNVSTPVISSGSGKHVPAVTIRPQNTTSPYKKPTFTNSTPTNRLQSGPSVAHSTDEIQRLQPSTSTEELNQEMANLEGLMKDLSAITASEFEC